MRFCSENRKRAVRGYRLVIPFLPYTKESCNFCIIPNILNRREVPPALADLLQMPKSRRQRKEEEAELSAYTARWLELADAALSATRESRKSP